MANLHLHWRFTAYNGGENDREIFHPIQISVIGYNDEQSVFEAARKIVLREQYKLNSVYECNACNFNQQNADNLRKLADAST